VTWLPVPSAELDAILIFGGDGTVHRRLPQLVGLRVPVLVVPCGSGNDFARALAFRTVRDSLDAWLKFSSSRSNVRSIDLGLITPLTPEPTGANESPIANGQQYYFCCVGGVGLDADIARRANQLPRWVRARGGYVLSLLPALLKFAPFAMQISGSRVAEPIVIAAFANAPTYGGGMKIAPRALLDDGLLDVCVIRDMNRFKLFCLFPSVYFGRHLSIPQVEYFQTERLQLETDEPLDVYADGEFVCRTPIEVSVERAALRVIVP
jgi:diacylglycerol kinase (ATP)